MGLTIAATDSRMKAVTCSCGARQFTLTIGEVRGQACMFATCTSCKRFSEVASYAAREG